MKFWNFFFGKLFRVFVFSIFSVFVLTKTNTTSFRVVFGLRENNLCRVVLDKNTERLPDLPPLVEVLVSVACSRLITRYLCHRRFVNNPDMLWFRVIKSTHDVSGWFVEAT